MSEHWRKNRKEMGEVIGVSHTTISNYVAEGAPCIDPGGRGREAVFDERAFVQWWVTNKVMLAQKSENLDDREQRLDIEAKELANAQKRKQLVERAAAVQVIRGLLVDLAAVLRTVPRRHGHKLLGTKTMPEAVRRLTTMVEEVIAELRVPDEWRAITDPAGDQIEADYEVMEPAAPAPASPPASPPVPRRRILGDGKTGVAGAALGFDDTSHEPPALEEDGDGDGDGDAIALDEEDESGAEGEAA